MSLLTAQLDAVDHAFPLTVRGQVSGISGLTIAAQSLPLSVGSLCRIDSAGGRTTLAEVIGFDGEQTLLMALSSVAGVSRGDGIVNIESSPRIWVSQNLLGRVLTGYGQPMDGKGPIPATHSRRIDNRSPMPLDRTNIRTPIGTGIRAIDGLHTCGLGQRMGIFSGPGVGKSTLLSGIAKNTTADVSVIALIGERGREVQEFIEHAMGPAGMARAVIIVSTSDEAPLLRVRAAKVACTVAEYFRDEGKNVLLMMDSLTRLAQAQRQIGLAAKEPPATRGFPPSVFSLLPEILERAGKTQKGSITGFYTVLVEGDDFNEPIPDAVKGITDGHLWLSRKLANRGHFPALDVLQSISRVRSDVCDKDALRMARRVLAVWATYQDIEDLVNIGAYVPGANLEYDLAVQCKPKILAFLQQEAGAPSSVEQTRKGLTELVNWIETTDRAIRTAVAQKQPPRPQNPRP